MLVKGRRCNSCKSEIKRSELDKNYSICPCCGYYMRFHAEKRILSLADKNSFHEWDGACNNPELIALNSNTALLVYSDFYYPDEQGVKRKTILCRKITVEL